MTKEELQEKLRLHKLWLENKYGGIKLILDVNTNLSSADLRSADLRSANLRSADLSSANLSSANLSSADLRSADLRFADLRSADLRFADLRFADLRFADLRFADLRFADLRFADLRSANLLTFMFERDTAYYCGDSKIRIGCEYHEIDYWLINYEDIGKKANYEQRHIIAYKYFIDLCASMYIKDGD